MDKVSIIIPAKNAASYIKRCLDSIRQLDYPQDLLEVIVIDNGSTDETQELVRQHSHKLIVNENSVNHSFA